jgi:hypothetical protein
MMLQPRSARRTPRALATFAEKIPHLVMNHPGDDLFHSARTKLDRAGIRCVSYYSATIKDGRISRKCCASRRFLGSQNVSGDATGNILTRVDQCCSQDDLTFDIHNHFFKGERFAYQSPEDVRRALAGVSNTVGATADVGHFASCGYDTVDANSRAP